MKDYRFGSQDGATPSYYVFTEASCPQDEAAFYRFDTPQEACALFNYLQVTHPGRSFSLGIHRDGTRRASIVERLEGVTVLSDEYERTLPWKDDPATARAADEASRRLGPTWKIDRELIGESIIVPNERMTASYIPWYLENRQLLPDDPTNLRSSIQELNVEGAGWVSLDDARALAKSHGHPNSAMLMVSECLVSYQVGEKGFGGTMAISPAEYAFMATQYLAKQQVMGRGPSSKPSSAHDQASRNPVGRDSDLPSPECSQSLDALKKEAKERALQKGRSYSPQREPGARAHSL